MNKRKAIAILQEQKARLNALDYTQKEVWINQTASYVKDFLGERSKEFEFIDKFHFWTAIWADTSPQQRQEIVEFKKESLRTYLDNCIESINHKGLFKETKSADGSSDWTKRHPILFEIIKWAVPILGTAIASFFIGKASNQSNSQSVHQSQNEQPKLKNADTLNTK